MKTDPHAFKTFIIRYCDPNEMKQILTLFEQANAIRKAENKRLRTATQSAANIKHEKFTRDEEEFIEILTENIAIYEEKQSCFEGCTYDLHQK
jgi:hypothetical protein